jgi:hypothetical protein
LAGSDKYSLKQIINATEAYVNTHYTGKIYNNSLEECKRIKKFPRGNLPSILGISPIIGSRAPLVAFLPF